MNGITTVLTMNRLRSAMMTLLLALLAGSAASAQETVITGMVLGQDGKPMPKAHISIMRPYQHNTIATVEAAEDGSYTIPTAERGFVLLRYYGVDHEPLTVSALLNDTTQPEINVRLRPHAYLKSFDSVRIVGDFNNYSYDNAPLLTKDSAGIYSIVLTTSARSLTYQLLGVTAVGAVNAPGAESYVFDGVGGYHSVVHRRNGSLTIVLDPAKLVRTDAKAEAIFNDSAMQRMAAIYADITKRREAYQDALTKNRLAGKSLTSFSHSWKKDLSRLAAAIKQERDSLTRQMLMVSYLDLGTLGAAADLQPAIARQALESIQPSSPLWSINPRLIMLATERTGEPDSVYQDYLAQVIDEHADPNVVSTLLYDGLTIAYSNKESARANTYYERLTRDYGSSRYAAMARVQFAMERTQEISANSER